MANGRTIIASQAAGRATARQASAWATSAGRLGHTCVDVGSNTSEFGTSSAHRVLVSGAKIEAVSAIASDGVGRVIVSASTFSNTSESVHSHAAAGVDTRQSATDTVGKHVASASAANCGYCKESKETQYKCLDNHFWVRGVLIDGMCVEKQLTGWSQFLVSTSPDLIGRRYFCFLFWSSNHRQVF